MKKHILPLICSFVLCSIVGCEPTQMLTDEWMCSIRLRSDSSEDDPCVIVDGGTLYIDIFSNHPSFIVEDYSIDILSSAEQSLQVNTTHTTNNGVCTLTFSHVSIKETSAKRLSITIKDPISGRSKELTATYKAYKFFYLEAAFFDTNKNEKIEEPVFNAGDDIVLRLYTNQESIQIKNFGGWPFNEYAEDEDSKLVNGRKYEFSEIDDYTTGTRHRDFRFNNVEIKNGDDSTNSLFIEAANERGEADNIASVSIKYTYYYEMIVSASMGNSKDLLDNSLLYGQDVYLVVNCNRRSCVVSNLFSSPNITGGNDDINWFEDSFNTGYTLNFDNGKWVAKHRLVDTDIPPGYLYHAHGYDGVISFTLTDEKTSMSKDVTINYHAQPATKTGPGSIELTKMNIDDVNISTQDVYYINEGETLSFDVQMYPETAEGKLYFEAPSGNAGKFEFSIDNQNYITNAYTTVNPKEKNDITYKKHVSIRGLNQGGLAELVIRAQTPGENGLFASRTIKVFVRHRLALVIDCDFQDILAQKGGTTGFDGNYFEQGKTYGWHGVPSGFTAAICRFKQKGNTYGEQSDYSSSDPIAYLYEQTNPDVSMISFDTVPGIDEGIKADIMTTFKIAPSNTDVDWAHNKYFMSVQNSSIYRLVYRSFDNIYGSGDISDYTKTYVYSDLTESVTFKNGTPVELYKMTSYFKNNCDYYEWNYREQLPWIFTVRNHHRIHKSNVSAAISAHIYKSSIPQDVEIRYIIFKYMLNGKDYYWMDNDMTPYWCEKTSF